MPYVGTAELRAHERFEVIEPASFAGGSRGALWGVISTFVQDHLADRFVSGGLAAEASRRACAAVRSRLHCGRVAVAAAMHGGSPWGGRST